MLFFRRAGAFSLLGGFLFVLVTGWFFFSGIGFAALYCPQCDCHYELSTPGCRTPIIYLRLACIALVGALGSFTNGWLRRRRERRLS